MERGGTIMNTFWLKIAGFAVLVVVVIVGITVFTSSEPEQAREREPKPREKTFSDQAEEDKQRFLAEPKAVDSGGQSQMPENQTIAERVQPTIEPPKPPEPVRLYFKELDEIEKIEAKRLLNWAVPGRSIGRLQVGFKLMVDNCRQIIRRWPDSWFAYRAKQMLADMPERYQKRYRVTEEEKDVSTFAKPRPGTKPFIIKD